MNIQDILKPATREQLETLTRSELIALLLGEQDIRAQAEAFARLLKEEKYRLEGLYVRIKSKIFSPSSEKSPRPKNPIRGPRAKNPRDRTLLPSERYPNATIIEQDIELDPPPPCSCCQEPLTDSGMTEITEVLTVIPKQYLIKRQIYHKYHCRNCHGDMRAAPSLPRIKPGSSYDDDFIIDVGVSKYCDLIPIERYASMAKRAGFARFPPHSLIELTHYLADFLTGVYELLKGEVLAAEVLYADETTHRMLEGDSRANWFLWGFSTDQTSYFECHDSRSGDVASELLKQSDCQFLVSDVYSGYNKATNLTNQFRAENGLKPIQNVFCNAHARRKFKEIGTGHEISDAFMQNYQQIYQIEGSLKGAENPDRVAGRLSMTPLFKAMLAKAEETIDTVSTKSQEAQALNYFIKNFDGLTLFTQNTKLPIDNNHQERLLRNPVIGRKTWYGTHSKRGAKTAAILFSIVESCKLNRINPRAYLINLVKDMHLKKPPYTPRQASLDQLQ